MLKAVVVADGRQDGCVGSQRDSRERIAIEAEARKKFRCHMLRIGCTAAVTGDQDLAAFAQRLLDAVGDCPHGGQEVAIGSYAVQQGARASEMTLNGTAVRHVIPCATKYTALVIPARCLCKFGIRSRLSVPLNNKTGSRRPASRHKRRRITGGNF